MPGAGTVRLPRDLSEALLWIAQHQGEVDTLWEMQKEHNKATDARFKAEARKQESRQSTMEKRLFVVVLSAMGAGGYAPDLLAKIFGS